MTFMRLKHLLIMAAAPAWLACSVEETVGPDSLAPSFRAEVATIFKGWFDLNPPPAGIFNACTGEFMVISGTYNLIVRTVTSASGETHFLVHSQANVKGVGATTGTEYVSLDLLNLMEKAGANGAAVLHLQYPLRYVAKGGLANMAGHIAIHVTVNANGTVTVNREEFVFDECQ